MRYLLYLQTAGLMFFALLPTAIADTRQDQFDRAMKLLNNGQPIEATLILDTLFNQTRELRVLLELARAHFLAGNFEKARSLFILAYETNPPPPVKARILNFIDQIDRTNGKINFGISLTHAQNPYRLPSQFGVNFGGTDLTLQEDKKKQNIFGLLYSASYEKKIGADADVRINASWRDLEHSSGDFKYFDSSIGQQWTKFPLEIRIGIQNLWMKTQGYRMPYIEFSYRYPIVDEVNFIPKIQLGSYQPDESTGLTGQSYKLDLPIEFNFNAHRSLTINLRSERKNADFKEQAYWSINPMIQTSLNYDYVNVGASLSFKRAIYDETDPFWGLIRRDKSFYVAVSAESDRIRYRGMIPSVGFYCDVNRSNIAFYKATDCGVTTNIRKIY